MGWSRNDWRTTRGGVFEIAGKKLYFRARGTERICPETLREIDTAASSHVPHEHSLEIVDLFSQTVQLVVQLLVMVLESADLLLEI